MEEIKSASDEASPFASATEDKSADKQETKEEKVKTKKKLSKSKIVALIIVLIIIWFLAVQVMAAERYQMQVSIREEENVMGVNPLGESLDFGDLSRNLGATRFVTLKNDSNKDRYIMVWKRGEIADMVVVSKSNFTLQSGEEEKLEFTIQVPPSAEIKVYKGKVMIFKWPKIF